MITCDSLSQKDLRKAKTQLKPTLVLLNKEKSRITQSLVQQKGEKKSFTTVITNLCACSITLQGRVQKFSLVLFALFLLDG